MALVPPEGVRIQRRDGTFVECDMLRDPGLDDRGCAGWTAVPREDYAPGPGDELQCDMLPPRTLIEIRLRTPAAET